MTESTARRIPGSGLLRNRSIGTKLSLGFGILVALTLVVIGLSLWAGNEATATIRNTSEIRQPTALAAYRAQASLYRMMTDMRGYLVLGEPQFIQSYRASEQDFRQHLARLQELSGALGPEDQRRLQELQDNYKRWLSYPDRLFALRDDQMDREPAYALLNTRGTELGGQVLINTNLLIDTIARQTPSETNTVILRDVAKFEGSFAAMFSGLRGYVTTRNSLFRYYEYENNLFINNEVWNRLMSQQGALTNDQRAILLAIDANRKTFLAEVPEQAFQIMQSPRWRLDLDLFSTEVTPLTDTMQRLLRELTASQQAELEADLTHGSTSLYISRMQTLVGGAFAVLLGLALAWLFRQNIVGPIRRLTQVAEQIRAGDLVIQAHVESGDEIGTLATTFNSMTHQLRHILMQVRKEKVRADSLLEVVIPIGVALSAEKDYNRLLETILLEAKSFCNADAGMLYLRTDDNQLKYVIVRNDTRKIALGGTTGEPIPYPPLLLYDPRTGAPNDRNVAGQAALSGRSVNIPNAYQSAEFDISGPEDFDEETGYPSLLTIPLKNGLGQVVGVLQLLNAQDPQTGRVIPFDINLQQMMESFSSLAVAALEAYIREQSLRREIRQLRIEIDEVKRQQQVSEIVETDFFQNLRSKARAIRVRNPGAVQDAAGNQAPQPPDASGDSEVVTPTAPHNQAS